MITITWLPSQEPDIASYRIERAIVASGPWVVIAVKEHDPTDLVDGLFEYNDATGNTSSWYRISAIDQAGQVSEPSEPFRPVDDATPLLPSLVGAISITVGDVGTLLNLGFTTIEIWRSDDDGGTWEEITAPHYTSAFSTSLPANTMYAIGGETLRFKLEDGVVRTITFPAAKTYWTTTEVANYINQVVPDTAAVDNNSIILSSSIVSRSSSLTILQSPAALGFPLTTTYGCDPRLSLQDEVVIYPYYDAVSGPNSRYKWRFSADGGGPISNFSDYVRAQETAVASTGLAVATAKFLTVDGRPARTRVIVAAESPTANDGVIDPGVPHVYVADQTGFVQIPLAQGARVRIAIEGSGLIRSFTVPNVASFDLIQALNEAPDMFSVQTIPALLTKRSL